MKYITFLLDGMADYPLPQLGNKTPLEAAKTPTLDKLAQNATFGTFLTLPDGFPTSSDVANMSVLGYDLEKYYTGRGAIESYGAGIPLDDRTVAFRMNLITIKDGTLEDYSAGHISDAEAEEILETLSKELGSESVVFHKGVSYRHLLYLKGEEFSPDVLYEKPDSSHGLIWKDLLPRPKNVRAEKTVSVLLDLISRSEKILQDHPVNKKRIKLGKNPANLIWPWSGGRKPAMPSFYDMYKKRGSIISAVDVILGLGRLGQMEICRPEGATGYIDTNYENKAKAAVELLTRNDFVYLHLEGIDECSHLGDLQNKIRAIEDADRRLIKVFLDEYAKSGHDELRILVLPDHPVPIALRKHTRDMVPFMMSGAGIIPDPVVRTYSEVSCRKGRHLGLKGRELFDLFFAPRVG